MQRPLFDPEREREYLARGWWRDDDVVSLWLEKHAAGRGGAPAIVHAGGVLSWRELRERVLRAAGGLKKKGVGRGDVVAVQLPNTPEFIVAHLAINQLGAVLCTIHMPYRGAEIEAITGHSGAKVFLNSLSMVNELDGEIENHPAPDARDPFLLLYTSGTTASPKGVLHSYRAMLGNARCGAAEHRLTAAD